VEAIPLAFEEDKGGIRLEMFRAGKGGDKVAWSDEFGTPNPPYLAR